MAHFVTGLQPALLETVHRTHQGHASPAHQGHYPPAHQGHHPPSHQHPKPKPPGSIELHNVHHVPEGADKTMSNHTNGNLTNKPVVRLCHIVKWPDYDGYGFNLHADKNKSAQYIGKVDEGSPAQAAGLKEGDRIIEVNGINITGDDHKQVVSKIKQNPKEAKLLVVDKESYEYFQSNGITITSSLPEVVVLKMPSREEQQVNGNKTPEVTETGKVAEEKQTTKLNLNMTVNEYRSKLASRKKYDPKKEAIDVKKKHEIIDKL